MSRYRKVDVRIWNDEKFATLSDRGKLAFLFVLTHPNLTALGAMRATNAGMAAELKWPEEAFREGFGEVLSKGIAKQDEQASFVWLVNFLRYNRPESPNVVKAWVGAIDLIPECQLKVAMLQRTAEFASGLGEAFMKALPKAFLEALPKGMPNQKQKQKQKQEHQQEQEPPRASCGAPNTECQAKSLADDDPVVMNIPIVGCGPGKRKEWSLLQSKIIEYGESFPGVDVLSECKKARQWCIDNPTKRKTAAGMPKFLSAWLGRVQNRSRPSPRQAINPDSLEFYDGLKAFASTGAEHAAG